MMVATIRPHGRQQIALTIAQDSDRQEHYQELIPTRLTPLQRLQLSQLARQGTVLAAFMVNTPKLPMPSCNITSKNIPISKYIHQN